jgi:hypothetical protein
MKRPQPGIVLILLGLLGCAVAFLAPDAFWDFVDPKPRRPCGSVTVRIEQPLADHWHLVAQFSFAQIALNEPNRTAHFASGA